MSNADHPLTADDIDLDLVAEHLAGALDPERAAELQALLGTDPEAAQRHAGYARDLDALAGILAAEPAPTVPDDVARRVVAALERETAVRVRQDAALAKATRDLRTAGRRRRIRGWGVGIGGVVALAGVVTLVVQTGLGSEGSSSASSAAGSSTSPAAERAPEGASAGRAGAAASGSAAVAPTAAPTPMSSVEPRVVTAANLDSVARTLYVASGISGFGGTGPAVAGPSAQAVHPTVEPPTCRPAGTAQNVRLLAESVVSFDGRPAVLLVLDPGAGHPGTVRAAVVRACGSAALLDRRVPVGG